jgi:hypothetical protein
MRHNEPWRSCGAFTHSMTLSSPSALVPVFARRAETRAFAFTATLWIAALWLMCRPFRGIRHDSILYTGQTFNALWPGKLSSDWFFLASTQDRYTLFTPLMSRAVQAVGLQAAEIGLLLAFNAFFLWASWLLMKELPSLLRWGALAALAALSHTYGGQGSFAFAEPFLVARTLAEPFGILALALLLRGRLAWSLLALLATIACHPLVAVPVIAIGWSYLCLQDRRWLHSGWLLVALPLLGLANVGPFGAVLRTFDAAWFHEVRTVDTQCFLLEWEVSDWAPIFVDLALVLQGWRLLAGARVARLALATAIASLVLTVAWGLGADVGHNVLLTQLQLWRVYWLLHFLALCLLPSILRHYLGRGDAGRWLAAAIVLACVAVESNWDTGWACCAWLALTFVAVERGAKLSRGILRLAIAGTLTMSVLIMAIVYSKTRDAVMSSGSFGDVSSLSIAFSLLLVSASVGLGGLWALHASRGVARAALVGVAMAALAFGASAWDQRPAWQLYTERAYAEAGRPFEGQIPEGASVFWEDSPLQTWLLLQRPSFFSLNQASGIVFSREAAMEFARRNRPYKELLMFHDRCNQVSAAQSVGLLKGTVDCRVPISIMKDFCNVPRGGADYLIFDWQRPEGLVTAWKFEEGPPSARKTWYLYDCSRLR